MIKALLASVKVMLCTALIAFSVTTSKAQIYDFSASTRTFVPLTGATAVDVIETDNELSGSIPLGFNFSFFGITQTAVKASSNGYLTFDVSSTYQYYYYPQLQSFSEPVIAPFWDNLGGSTGSAASYKTEGDPGNRIFTFEWLNWRWPYYQGSAGISLQVKLYENGNKIEFLYRQESGSAGPYYGAQIGLAKSYGNYYALSDASASPSIVLNPNSIYNRPANNQVYTFVPGVAPVIPGLQSSAIIASPTTSQYTEGSMALNINWTKGNGNNRIVLMKETASSSDVAPISDGVSYPGSPYFGDYGIGSGWYCVYNGNGNSVMVDNLSSGRPYKIQIIEYNGWAGSQLYLTTTSTTNPVVARTPLVRPTSAVVPVVSAIGPTKVRVGVQNSNAYNVVVFMKQGDALSQVPVIDNTYYNADSNFGSGSEIGGWYCVYNGNSNIYNLEVDGLTPLTNYVVYFINYNGEPGHELYNNVATTDNPVKVKTFAPHGVGSSSYTFSASSGSFTPLSGGIDVDEIENYYGIFSGSIPIGFDFKFQGTAFSTVKASASGFITFSQSVDIGYPYYGSNPLNNSEVRPMLAPLMGYLGASSGLGKASYKTVGAPGNRVFTMEFLNWSWQYYQSPSISFQVKLYEVDNRIEYVYHQQSGSPDGSGASIGLGFMDRFDYLSVNSSLPSAGVSSSSETSLTTRPANGQVFTFTPGDQRADQTINFSPVYDMQFTNNKFELTAVSDSGLPIIYSSSDPSVATVSGNVVTLTGLGTVTVTASQEGNEYYHAAPDEAHTFDVLTGDQTIELSAEVSKGVGDGSYKLPQFASSGLPITYTSSNPAVATVSGNTVTIVALGTTTITANQAGNALFNAAPTVMQSLTVKPQQTINFGALATKTFGDPAFTVTATASSGLPVSFQSSNPAVATVSGSTVTIVGGGTATIKAIQAGNASFGPVTAEQTLTVNKVAQTITFNELATKKVGDNPFNLSATSSSGMAVTYSTTGEEIRISGNQVTILKAGSVTIKADQAGNTSYSSAPSVERTFCINPVKPTVTASNLDSDAPVLTSNSSAGNQWLKDGAAISGQTNATLTVTGPGVYTVQVSAEGCKSEVSEGKSIIVTGTEEYNISSSVVVYPNPVESEFVIDVSSLGIKRPVSVSLIDLSGKQLQSWTGKNKFTCNIGGFKSGNYLINIKAGRQVITKQITKK